MKVRRPPLRTRLKHMLHGYTWVELVEGHGEIWRCSCGNGFYAVMRNDSETRHIHGTHKCGYRWSFRVRDLEHDRDYCCPGCGARVVRLDPQ